MARRAFRGLPFLSPLPQPLPTPWDIHPLSLPLDPDSCPLCTSARRGPSRVLCVAACTALCSSASEHWLSLAVTCTITDASCRIPVSLSAPEGRGWDLLCSVCLAHLGVWHMETLGMCFLCELTLRHSNTNGKQNFPLEKWET